MSSLNATVPYEMRAGGFLLGCTEIYAPFDFDTRAGDNGAYLPIRVNLPEPPESTPRVAALNFILAIPHYIVLLVFGIAAFVVAIIGWFAVLFTGAWPQAMRDFLVKDACAAALAAEGVRVAICSRDEGRIREAASSLSVKLGKDFIGRPTECLRNLIQRSIS